MKRWHALFALAALAGGSACNNGSPTAPIRAADVVVDAVSTAPVGSASVVSSSSAATTAAPAPTSKLGVVTAAADTDATSLIRAKRLEARAEGRVLVVYVGASWCEPCKRFKAEIASGRLDARLSKITLLAFDADADVDRLHAAGYTVRFVPFAALPGPDGKPLELVEAKGKGGQAWRELLDKLDAWNR